MKKRVYGKKLGRSTTARKALFRSLLRSLVMHGSIKTTKAKAEFLKRQVDSIITLARNNTVASRRKVYANLANDRLLTDLIFKKVAPSFSKRSGGFTRVIPLPQRGGDRAEMARIEWVESIEEDSGKGKGKKSSNTKTKQKKATRKTNKKRTTLKS